MNETDDKQEPGSVTVGAIIASVSASVVADALAELQKHQTEMLTSVLVQKNWSEIAAVSGAMATISGVMASPAALVVPQAGLPTVEGHLTTEALERRVAELEEELGATRAALRENEGKDMRIARLSAKNRRNVKRALHAERREIEAEVRGDIERRKIEWLQRAVNVMAVAYEEEHTQVNFTKED